MLFYVKSEYPRQPPPLGRGTVMIWEWITAGTAFQLVSCSISFQSSTRVQGIQEILHSTRQGLLLFHTLNLICRMCDPQSRRYESLYF